MLSMLLGAEHLKMLYSIARSMVGFPIEMQRKSLAVEMECPDVGRPRMIVLSDTVARAEGFSANPTSTQYPAK